MLLLFQPLKSLVKRIRQGIEHAFKTWTKPAKPSQLLGTLADLNRSKSQLVAENALLRQQLIVLNRQSKVNRPQFSPLDRLLIGLLASKVLAWKQAPVLATSVIRVKMNSFRGFI